MFPLRQEKYTPEECFFKDEKCRFCSTTGHIKRACLKKKAQIKKRSQKKPKNVKTVEEELLTVSINTVKRADIISITPKID